MQRSNTSRNRYTDSMTGPGLDFASHQRSAAYGTRFAAHSEFDAVHDDAALLTARRFEAKVKSREKFSNMAAAHKEQEQQLLRDYPHGLPVGICFHLVEFVPYGSSIFPKGWCA